MMMMMNCDASDDIKESNTSQQQHGPHASANTKQDAPAAAISLLSHSAREDMQTFWKEHSHEASEQEMMLDSNAEVLGREEVPEILSAIPDVTSKDVLELGAGIGRFTGHLACTARSVTAVDFMETFIARNRELNSHFGNCEFMQADVTTLELKPESYDLIFSNWLLMYLDEREVYDLFTNLLIWLRPGGYFFFRESCYHQSGNKSREYNPTKYRDPATYNHLLQSVSIATEDGNGLYAFEIIMSKSVQTYVKLKSNRNQICWLLHKVERSETENHGYKTFQEFLDMEQYSSNGIRCYEWIFGRNFCSPGGLETTEEFVKLLSLKPGQQVLDVGCGIGGGAFLMAKKYDVSVTGMDLSANMVSFALDRADEFKDHRVQFELADATKRDYPPESFDVIYSRDTILHIRDKQQLFTSFYRWLKPGGKLLISDYCCRTDGQWSDTFTQYVQKRGYHLVSVEQYTQLLAVVGFKQIKSEDRTEQFINTLTRELQLLENNKQEFIKELSAEDYGRLSECWKEKLAHCAVADHHWGLFCAEK